MTKDELQRLAMLASDLYEVAGRAEALADSIVDKLEAFDPCSEKTEKEQCAREVSSESGH